MCKIHIMSISLPPAMDLQSASALSQLHVYRNIQGPITDNILVLSILEHLPPENVHFSSSSYFALRQVLPLFGGSPDHLVKFPKISVRWLGGERCLQRRLKTWVLALRSTWRKEKTNFCELFFNLHTCYSMCIHTNKQTHIIKSYPTAVLMCSLVRAQEGGDVAYWENT